MLNRVCYGLLALVSMLPVSSSETIHYGRVRIVNRLEYPVYADTPLQDSVEVLPGRRVTIKDAYDRSADEVQVDIGDLYILERTRRRLPLRFRIVLRSPDMMRTK